MTTIGNGQDGPALDSVKIFEQLRNAVASGAPPQILSALQGLYLQVRARERAAAHPGTVEPGANVQLALQGQLLPPFRTSAQRRPLPPYYLTPEARARGRQVFRRMLAADAAQETQIKGIGAVPPDTLDAAVDTPDALDASVDAPDAIDIATDLDAASAKGGEELVACMHRVFGQAIGSCMGPLVRAQVERWLVERGITPAVARAAYDRALRSRLVP